MDIFCEKCGELIATKEYCTCGRSCDFVVIKKCAPCGHGSALFDRYICVDCDPVKIKWFIKQYPYTGPVVDAIRNFK
jgi:hypothetical protein